MSARGVDGAPDRRMTAWSLLLAIGCSGGKASITSQQGTLADAGDGPLSSVAGFSGGGVGHGGDGSVTAAGRQNTLGSASAGGAVSAAGTGSASDAGGATLLPVTANGGTGPAGSAGAVAILAGGTLSTSTAAGGFSSVGGTSHPSTFNGGAASGGTTAQPPPSANCATVRVGDVSMSVPSGTFVGTLSVELATKLSGVEIRYTTDGTAPSATSSQYTSALSFTKTTRLRAAVFSNGSMVGLPSTSLYVARAANASQAHDIPVIVLDSYGSGPLPTSYTGERPYVDVAVLAYDAASGSSVTIGNAPTLTSLAGFHVRGNSSSMFPKLSYRIELRMEDGADRDCPFLGMPEEADWALVGPYADKTLIHNNFVYGLGREIGMQAPRVKLAEVYVNVDADPLSADDYQGVYQVVETVKNQKNRLNLKQLDQTKTAADQITGGYIFKNEWLLDPDTPDAKLECPASVTTKPWNFLELIDPMPIASQQRDYLTSYLADFHNALHGSSPSDAANGYPKYIDPTSFVDTVIINEFTRSLDAYARSQYFYKDRDKKLNAGPLWDFDLTAGVGSSSGYANLSTEGWQYESNASRLGGTTKGSGGRASQPSVDWFPLLIADPAFKAQLITRWKELRTGALSDPAIAARIDSLSLGLSAAAQRNFAKWDILATTKTISGTMFQGPTETTWEGQISYMKLWLQQRAAWIDSQWK